MIYYFLQTLIISSLLTVTYFLLFRTLKQFALRRFLLLLIPVLSLSIPLIKIPHFFNVQNLYYQSVSNVLNTVTVVSSDVEKINKAFDFTNVLFEIYFLIGLALFIKLFLQMRHIFLLKYSSRLKDGIYYTSKISHAFSFLGFIFIPKSENHKEQENSHIDLIIRHEKIHSEQNHSLDILFFELLKIVFWLNPFFYILRKEISNVHEFLVDEELLKEDVNIEEYCQTLLQNNHIEQFSIINNFNYSLTKIRFIMMTKNNHPKGISFRILGMLIVMLSSTLLFANLTFENRASSSIGSVSHETQDSLYKFSDLDVVPNFPGGMDKMMLFIAQNTKYPQNAKDNGIQGKVFVEFIIDQKGKVTNVKLKRSVDKELDAEAIRVVSLMPDWNPGEKDGKKVKTSFIIPINFKLFKD